MAIIAVTGASGNLGGLVIEHLLTLGVDASQIIPLVRSAEKGARFSARGLNPRVASYDDPVGFQESLKGVDKLVLISPPSLDNAIRLHQLHNAVMAAHASELSQLVWVSLSDPEERTFGLEDVDLAIEYSVRAVGIPFTILRNSVYLDELGPELAVAVASGELLSVTENHTMNWAPRADQAAAIAGAITQEGHLGATYNLVSSQLYTYDEIARLLGEATGRTITHRTAARDEVVEALARGGMNADHAKSMVDYFQKAIALGKCYTISNDIERLSGRSGLPTAEYLAGLVKPTQD